MKTTKLFFKIISLVLSLLVFTSVVPINSLAAEVNELIAVEQTETTEKEKNITEEKDIEEKENSEAESAGSLILGEDESKRSLQTKFFKMSDGSYKAAIYSSPIHYEENGEWKDIDNTLIYEDSKSENDFNGYVNKAGAFRVKFNEKANDDGLLKIEEDKFTLSMAFKSSLLREFYSKAEVMKKEEITDEQNYAYYTQKSVKSVGYNNISKDCDFEYILTGSGVKENIVLKTKSADNIYKFDLCVSGIYLKEDEGGNIVAFSNESGEELFAVPAPYMSDAKGEISYDVTYSLEQKAENTYTLIVKASREWLNSKNREYPVKIDPTIILNISKAETYDCYVDNSEPSIAFPYDYYLYAGYSSLGKTRTFVRFALPELPDKCSIITNASLCFIQYDCDYNGTDYINAYKVTSSWNNEARNVTWNNQPTCASTVLDYCQTNPDVGKQYKFDITKTVKEWYEGETNNGIMLKSNDESSIGRARFISAENNSYDAYPRIVLTYRNNKGIESYWSYTTLSAGAAGTASINDYTGNLVYEIPLASDNNELMSTNLSLIYNGYCAGTKFVCGKNGSSKTSAGRGFRLNIQTTVLPSSEYGLTGTEASNYPYVYTDGDGTEHYFRKITENGTTKYEDEDGLGLTLTLNEHNCKYTITDKSGNLMLFNLKGNIFEYRDKNGHYNHIYYCEESSEIGEKERISHIKNSSGHEFVFSYSSPANYLTKITDSAGRETTISKNDTGCITSVNYSNGMHSYLTWDNDKNITTVYDSNNYKLKFSYTSGSAGKRVSSVTEYGNGNGNSGQKMTFDRSRYNTTVIRTAGKDGVFNNDDDILTTYQFDNWGRTVSQQVRCANGTDYGAGAYAYKNNSESGNTNIKSANYISKSAGLGKNKVNLISGGNCGSTTDWTDFPSSSVTSSVGVSSTNSYMGRKSLYIKTTSGNAGSYNCLRQTVNNIIPGKKYTFSVYVKTLSLASIGSSEMTGAYIRLKQANGSTTISDSFSNTIECETDTAIDNGWRRLTITVTADENATRFFLYLCLTNVTGTAYFDCAQLERSSTANAFNLLENAGFEKRTSNMPSSWTASNLSYSVSSSGTVTNGCTEAAAKQGDYSLRISGNPNESKGVYQYVSVEGNQKDTYILSGWSKAYAVNDTYHSDAAYEIVATVYFKDSDGEDVGQKNYYAKFNTTISDWQYTAKSFSLQYSGHSDYVPYKIKVMPHYNNQANHAYFDHIQLVKDVAQSYVYDSEGNMTSVSANAQQKTGLAYNDDNDIKSYTDAAGNKTTYSYENRNLKETKSARGLKTVNTYNTSTKNIQAVEVKNAAETLVIKTGSGYNSSVSGTHAGSYKTSVSDEHGNTTNYAYDYSRGRINSVTDADNNTITYTYVSNNDDRLSSVEATSLSKVAYDYSGTRLDNILFGSGSLTENYSFVYDNYGNVSKTKVGSQTLSTNTYGANNGALSKMTYGNGDYVEYAYNDLGNVSSIKKNGSTAYSWTYDSSQTPIKHTDSVNKLKYNYRYDSIGRLIRQDVTNTATEETSYSEFGYDIRNNLTKLSVYSNGKSATQKYSYSAISGIADTTNYAKDNLPTRYSLSSTRYVDYSYDTLNRLTLKALDLNGNTLYTNYLYHLSDRNSGDSQTYRTNQLAVEIIGNQAYKYAYDSLGNITSVRTATRSNAGTSNSGVGSYSPLKGFEYDKLGELKRENNTVTDTTKVWTYDRLGNIVSRKEYNYATISSTPTADLTNPTKTVTYRYGNDNKNGWNRLLTGVNLDGSYDDNGDPSYSSAETITYDAIGNPTTYLGATLTWFGRQLKSYKKSGTTINYKYDADGLRASKTVGSNKTTYQYLNGQLVYENRNGTDIFYYYDSYGHLTAIKYYEDGGTTATMLYVATNSFGDVIGLYSGTGSLLVKYEYDAWGNIIAETNASGGNLSTTAQGYSDMCAIRYRGYYYDKDTGLYYLQSRYYNPEVGRFLNADSQLNSQSGVLGYNVFAYCQNNPVMFSDSTGHIAFLAITGAIGAVAGGIAGGIIAAKQGKSVLAGIGIGAAAGGLIGLGAGAAAGALLAGSATASTVAVVSGAGMFATAVSTGGLGTGAALLADNVSRTIKCSGTVLYSGGVQATQKASEFASQTGGTIIDNTKIGEIASVASKLPESDFTAVWSQASVAFCNQASGTVNAFVSNSAYRGSDSIFWGYEMPTLLNNSKVTEIIIHIFE